MTEVTQDNINGDYLANRDSFTDHSLTIYPPEKTLKN